MNRGKLLLLSLAIMMALLLAGCEKAGIHLTLASDKAVFSQAGEVITYTYTVINAGDTVLSNVSLVDPRLDPVCPANMSTIWVNDSRVCTGTYTTTQDDVTAGVIVGSATVYASARESGCCGSNSIGVESSARLEIPLEGTEATISLTKTYTPAMFNKVGDVITYSYTIQNTSVLSISGICSVNDNKVTVTCNMGGNGLAPNTSVTCGGKYTITQADFENGEVTNTATAKCGNVTSPAVNAQIVLDRQPVLNLTKTADKSTFAGINEQITYTYTVQNVGSAVAQGPFILVDDKLATVCPSMTSLAVGQTFSCSASYTTAYTDLVAGVIRNTASVSNASISSNVAVSEVRIDPKPVLTVSKSADRGKYSYSGEVISYQYIVRNSGNVVISEPFLLVDNKLNSWQCFNLATLPPGQSFTCTGTYTVKASEVGKAITNWGWVIGTYDNKAVNSNSAQATVAYQVPEPPPTRIVVCTPAMGQDPSNPDCYCSNFLPDVPSWCLD